MIVLPRTQHRRSIEDTRHLLGARPLRVQLCITKNKGRNKRTMSRSYSYLRVKRTQIRETERFKNFPREYLILFCEQKLLNHV